MCHFYLPVQTFLLIASVCIHPHWDLKVHKLYQFTICTSLQGGNERWQLMTPSCGFSKNVSSKERVKACLFVTFNIILKHIFPESFIKFPQVVQKIWRNSVSILANFHQFSSLFWIFWHYLVKKKLMMSAYNRWCQHFVTFNIF